MRVDCISLLGDERAGIGLSFLSLREKNVTGVGSQRTMFYTWGPGKAGYERAEAVPRWFLWRAAGRPLEGARDKDDTQRTDAEVRLGWRGSLRPGFARGRAWVEGGGAGENGSGHPYFAAGEHVRVCYWACVMCMCIVCMRACMYERESVQLEFRIQA